MKGRRSLERQVHPAVAAVLLVVTVGAGGVYWYATPKLHYPAANTVAGTFPHMTKSAPLATTKTLNESRDLSIDQAADLLVVVNKKHKLPADYAPTLTTVRGAYLRQEAADALEELLEAAEANGMSVRIVSPYRSYATQVSVYNGYVAQNGQSIADTFSARPGHSEHQTGLAVDVGNANGACELQICFGSTGFGTWLAEQAQEFGFIIRYPEGKESVTGYQYEPWHLRYVGKDIASTVNKSSKTLEEYFSIDGGDY